MRTDNDIQLTGIRLLIEAMGELDTERFIHLVSKDTFDYHLYRHMLYKSMSLEEIQKMNARQFG